MLGASPQATRPAEASAIIVGQSEETVRQAPVLGRLAGTFVALGVAAWAAAKGWFRGRVGQG